MENTIESKRKYLEEEIEKRGYNTDKFVEYMKNKKGDRLDDWTPDELKEAITNFQKENEEKKNPFDKAADQTNREGTISGTFRSNQRLTTNFCSMEEEIECKKPDQTELSGVDNLEITLSLYNIFLTFHSPEKREKIKNAIFFLVETSPKGYSVRRSDKDFKWLRNTLKKLFPGIFIPPITKKELSDSSNEVQVEKVKTSCTYFIREVLKDVLLRSSKVLYDFLTVSENDFNLKKTSYDSISSPKVVADIQTRTGTITLDGSIFEDGKRFDQSKTNVSKNISILGKLNKKLKELNKNMRIVGGTFDEISKIFEELTKESRTYLDSNVVTVQALTSIKKLTEAWGYNHKKQTSIIKLHFKQFFKYIDEEYKASKELYDKFEVSKTDYLKSKEKLEKKKEDLFKKQDIKKWNLPPEETNIDKGNKTLCIEKMLPDETKALEENKKMCCYFGNYFESEFNRVRGLIDELYKKICEEFFNKNSQFLKELNDVWVNFSNFESLSV